MRYKKIMLLSLFVVALILAAGCSSRSDSSSSSLRRGGGIAPVDDWRPLVQSSGMAESSAWRFETHELPESPPDITMSWGGLLLGSSQDFGMMRVMGIAGEAGMAELMRVSVAMQEIEDSFPIDEWGFRITPPYINGMFLNGDAYGNWHIHVSIIERMADEAADFLAFLSDFEDVVIQKDEFSMDELMEAHLSVLQNAGVYINRRRFHLGWIDAMINRVVIGLLNYSEEEKEYFRREIYDSPMIIFEDRS